jgi:UDP-N-acetylglucosamine acyltransferase
VKIHPTAIVGAKAELGSNVQIGPYSIVGDDVVLHDDVEVGSHVVIEGPSEIGRGTRLFPFSYVGQVPQDLKFAGEQTRLVVGERNIIREYVTMHRGTAGGGGVTSVGNDNLFMAQSHIAHDCHIGSHCIFANCATLAGHVEVADFVTLGAYSGVHQYCRLGAHAFVGGYSVVVKDALPYATSVGNHALPAQIYQGLRRGVSQMKPEADTSRLHVLLQKLSDSGAGGQAETPKSPEVDYLVEFIEGSRRGVIK